MPKKTPTKKRLVIIDGNAIIHRAYHAIPPLTVKDGTMVNAVYGFTSMLLKVIADLKPDCLAVSFDVAGGTFRDKIYTEYKATRVKADQDLYDQIPLVYQVVEAFNLPIFVKPGFEADDVIGTIVNNPEVRRQTSEVIIVTGDMDMLQLVDDNVVKVYELRKGLSDIVLFDADKVKEKYGFGPEMIVEYKALRGDASDNIPGVPGIGEKTATELIQNIGGVDKIYKQISDQRSAIRKNIKPGVLKKLEGGEANARMSKELATIRRDVKELNVDLTKCAVPNWNTETIKELFRRFEFFSLLKRVPGIEKTEESPPSLLGATARRGKKNGKQKSNTVTATKKNLVEVLDIIKKEPVIAAKHILNGSDPIASDLSKLVFATEEIAYVIDWQQLSDKDKKVIALIFTDRNETLIGHDLKETIKALKTQNIEVKNQLFDVMIASYVVNSSTRAHDLASLVQRELGADLPASIQQGSLFGTDTETEIQALQYIWQLYTHFTEALKAKGDRELFDSMEMRLIPVLAEMELNGIMVDTDMLQKLSHEVAEAIATLTKKICTEAGEEFNVASSTQLRDILFEKMKLPTDGIKKGKTGYSTAASELEKLRGLHPIIEYIEEHRELAKLQNTYIDVLPTLINPKTGRIHTHFNQAVAATGRLSSSDPNLQNIPIRTALGQKVRQAFISAPGFSLVAADYSQMELRIVASMADDKKMIEIFNKNEDIHRATAAAINNVPLDKVTREMRYAAKEVNFGVLYGMGAYGLAWRAGIPQGQAKEFIEKYFSEFSGVKTYVDNTIAFAKKNGYVETLFKRRRYIPEISATNFQLRSAGERMAVNMPVQGTLADISKLAMIQVSDFIKKTYTPEQVRLLLQVHDELVLEVKEGLEEKVGEEVKKIMEDVVTLAVPVVVDVHVGKRWGELK